MAENLLEVRNLSKTFGGVVANENISIDVARGGIVGLIGPNGSGKTTLFNSIVGSHPIDSGSVRFDGHELSRLRTPQIARLGLLRTFQHAHVYDGMTCLQNLQISVPQGREGLAAMFCRFPRESEEKARGLLDFVGLDAKRQEPASELSFGQRKLLEFAMALMNEPKMLLLDEPTAGINPTLIHAIVGRIRCACASFGITFMIIEHNLGVIAELADQTYCLAHGKVCAKGTPDLIRTDRRVIEVYLGSR